MSLATDVDKAKRVLEARVRECLATAIGERTPAGGTWTLKEMVAHVAFWEEAAVFVITYMYRGQPAPSGYAFGSGYVPGATWPRADEHNAREAEWARGQTMGAVLERWDRAYEELATLLETVTDEERGQHAS